jgi:hypothetical protein
MTKQSYKIGQYFSCSKRLTPLEHKNEYDKLLEQELDKQQKLNSQQEDEQIKISQTRNCIYSQVPPFPENSKDLKQEDQKLDQKIKYLEQKIKYLEEKIKYQEMELEQQQVNQI